MELNKYKNLSASGLVKSGYGKVVGIVINSHTSGTLKLWDNTAGSGSVICNTITFGAAERNINTYDMSFSTGCYATIGGTADITISYE